ncbi:MAG TPA: exodeoxyribonuclease I [Arenimonas sp.]|nr:exodeoxyribonuclease I [Arenimonas sp.]
MANSFLWYDLETFGRDPRRTRIAQFAAQRTDAELNPVGEPLSLFCQPALDLLPSPEATMITGITPQQALAEGLREAEFMARLHEEFAQPGTCAVGYNSIRFDDEFVRFGLYRNFYDPYEREWRNGNSRWDLLDVFRLAHALRPEGLEWPQREDGRGTSFKLEHLALANGVREGDAHEALSDVRALIGLARKFKAAQPRLWEYALKLRDKRHVAGLIDITGQMPLLHISQRYPAERLCAALVLPLAQHPQIATRFIVVDLDADPGPLLRLDADAIRERLYIRTADLPEGEQRIPLKEVHSNKCPVLLPLSHLREADYTRLGIDRERCLQHAERLRADPALAEKVRRVFASDGDRAAADADAALYDGFASEADKRQFFRVRRARPEELAGFETVFADPRYRELLFRYRARNWPEQLSEADRVRWNDYRRQRLQGDHTRSEHSFDSYFTELAQLRATHPPGPVQALLDALEAWGRTRQAELA